MHRNFESYVIFDIFDFTASNSDAVKQTRQIRPLLENAFIYLETSSKSYH